MDIDFDKKVHSLPPLGKDTVCTVIILIPNGIDDSSNNYLEESFNKCVSYIGLSHLDTDGFTTDKVNALVVDHRVKIDDLNNISTFCENLKVIPLSFYIRYEDLDNLDSNAFLGRVIPMQQ